MVNANYGHEHESVVSSINFHPSENILLTSGLDRKVKLFELKNNSGVDGSTYNNVSSSKKANKIQSLFTPDLPVYTTRFIQGGDKAILTGNRKHFYIYDIESNKMLRQNLGNVLDEQNLTNMVVNKHNKDSQTMVLCSSATGYAHVICQKTCKLITSFKMNGSCNAACFSSDDNYLFTAGDQAEIYQWDMRYNTSSRHSCLSKIQDEGNFSTTCLAISPNSQTLASSGKMGTINLFNFNQHT